MFRWHIHLFVPIVLLLGATESTAFVYSLAFRYASALLDILYIYRIPWTFSFLDNIVSALPIFLI